jgi:hypothetical protein
MLVLTLLACSTDYAVKNMCVEEGGAFDVEKVSTLQDAAGYPGARDAVVLDYDAGALGEADSWRITRVDVLAMVPERFFDRYEGGDVLRVDVWDAERPRDDGDWQVEQAIEPGALDWERVTLPQDAYWAGQRGELEQRRAWMSFDFGDVTDVAGMTSGRYAVSVAWGAEGLPTIGYSNFNLSCGKNWTDYGDGAWTLNSADGDGSECSWPMLRVQVETRTADDGSCTGTSVAIE